MVYLDKTPLSAHVAHINYLCALGKASAAADLVSAILYSDYRSRCVAWLMVRDAAMVNGDTALARKAGNEADCYQRRLEQ